MRRKPPEGFSTINAGAPWSEMDLEDLHDFLESGMPVAETSWRKVGDDGTSVYSWKSRDKAAAPAHVARLAKVMRDLGWTPVRVPEAATRNRPVATAAIPGCPCT
jgi:hypothetical protein